MTPEQFVGLWANMPRVRAGRIREQAAMSGVELTTDAVYNLTLAETGSEEQAAKAMAEHAAQQLRTGREVT